MMTSWENYEDFLQKLGVSLLLRKLATLGTPIVEVTTTRLLEHVLWLSRTFLTMFPHNDENCRWLRTTGNGTSVAPPPSSTDLSNSGAEYLPDQKIDAFLTPAITTRAVDFKFRIGERFDEVTPDKRAVRCCSPYLLQYLKCASFAAQLWQWMGTSLFTSQQLRLRVWPDTLWSQSSVEIKSPGGS